MRFPILVLFSCLAFCSCTEDSKRATSLQEMSLKGSVKSISQLAGDKEECWFFGEDGFLDSAYTRILNIESSICHDRDEEGYILKSHQYSADSLTRIIVYNYNEDKSSAQLSEQLSESREGTVDFDESGRGVHWTSKHPEYAVTTEIEYDVEGNLISKLTTYGGGIYTTEELEEFEFEDGVVIRKLYRMITGYGSSTERSELDDYRFDEKGNWIYCVETIDEIHTREIHREIIYYE